MRRGEPTSGSRFEGALAPPPVAASEDPFAILAAVVRQVAQSGGDDLQPVLESIVAALRSVVGLEHPVFLFNYAADQVYHAGPGTDGAAQAGVWCGLGETPFYLENDLWQDSSFKVGINRLGEGGRGVITIPLSVEARQLGLVGIIEPPPAALTGEEERLLIALADQAALVLERFERRQETFDISHALSKVFLASRSLSSPRQAEDLLQVIADQARRLSRADFVVLYEYFEERADVRVPPTLSGSLFRQAVLEERGKAKEHHRSAVFHLLERGEPFYAPQGAEDWRGAGLIDADSEDEQTFFAREEVCSSAGFPLRIDDEPVGILFLNYRTEVPFRRSFRERLEIFANQAAIAFGNARFFQRSERNGQKLKLLHEIGRELSSAVDREAEQIFETIRQQTGKLIETRNFLLCRYDEVTGKLSLPVAEDEVDGNEPAAFLAGLDKGLLAYVCRKSQPLFARRNEIETLIAAGEAESVGAPAKVWLGVPLIARGHVLGAIAVQSYDKEDEFDEQDQELLVAIAAQAAIAIDNYGLLHAYRHQVDELWALLDLSQEIRAGKLALTDLLSSVLDHVCRLGGCDDSLIFWHGAEGRADFEILATSGGLRSLRGRRFAVWKGVAGRVLQTGETLVVNDYRNWPEKLSFGKFEPLRVCGVPLLWKNRVVGAITLASNRTDRELAKREVELLERFAGPVAITIQNALDGSFRRALVETGPYAIVGVNMNGQITELSVAAESLFKYSREELEGEKVRKLYWDGESEGTRISTQLKQAGRFEGEIFGRSKEGEKIPLFCSAVFLKGQDGENLGSVGVLEDLRIGALRGRTQALVHALGEIYRAGDDLPALLDLVVWHAVNLLYASAGCLFVKAGVAFEPKAHFGLDPASLEALRRETAQAVLLRFAGPGGEERPRPIIALDEMRLSPLSRSAFPYPIHAAGRLLGILWIESPEANHFHEDQEILRVVASQAALAIHRAQLREERERTLHGLVVSSNAISVGQIATSFFHEAKNALNGMSLTVHNVMGDLKKEPDLKAKGDYVADLGDVLSEMQRLDDLSRRLQRFTQQGLRPAKSEAYFNEVVGRVQQLLESTRRRKKIKVEERFDNSLDRPATGNGNPVWIDEAQIQQVLMNILLNAVDASPARGRLTVETHLENQQVIFRLIDQGHGISEEDRKRIFEPFFTTKGDLGTGLGLYISKLLVEENHQGRIEVSSSPGKGAVFSVILPMLGSKGGK